MGLVERAIGERGRWTYAFRTLLDSGAVLALGSDCPVASPNPFWGIHAAVTRQRRDGSPPEGWYPEQRLTVAEAVAGYTLGPAYASGQLDRLGSLSPGKLADLVVLDRDIFAVPPSEICRHASRDDRFRRGDCIQQWRDTMNPRDLLDMAGDPRFIPGIYNYCDRWCERCAYTGRCLNFVHGEIMAAELEEDDESEALAEQLGELLQDAVDLD